MIRTIVTPKNQQISIQLPSGFVGKRVEVIAFTIDEVMEKVNANKTEFHLASEKVLAKDWLSHEEDLAWKNL